MIDLLLRICYISAICGGTGLRGQRRDTREADFDDDQRRYESKHYTDYSSNRSKYEIWPELNRKETNILCQLYVRKLYPNKNLSSVISQVQKVNLYYWYLVEVGENTNLQIVAVRCTISPPVHGRKYIHFTRSPTPDCVYLMKQSRKNLSKQYLALEICKFHTYRHLKSTGKLYKAIYKPQRSPGIRNDDTFKEQYHHEKKHMAAYSTDKATYREWPELEDDRTKKKYCRILLEKLFPLSKFSYNRPVFLLSQLLYTHLDTNVSHLLPIEVNVLFCDTAQPVHHRRQYFIKAPPMLKSIDCVFLVKRIVNIPENSSFYRIIKHLCCQDDMSPFGSPKLQDSAVEHAQT